MRVVSIGAKLGVSVNTPSAAAMHVVRRVQPYICRSIGAREMRIFRPMQDLQKHILLLPKWYPHAADPQNGSFIQLFARAMSERRPVTVVFPEPVATPEPIQVQTQSQLLEIRVPYVQSKVPVVALRKMLNFWKYRSAMLRGLAEMNAQRRLPDLIHAQVLIRPAMFAAQCANRWNIPWILTEHSSEFIRDGSLSILRKLYIRNLCMGASRLVTVSEPLAEGLRRATGRKRIDVIPNLIEFPEVPPVTADHSILTIGVVADLVDAIKNISGLLRALAVVKDQMPPFVLKIAGEGPNRNSLEKLTAQLQLNENVEFLGSHTHAEVLRLLPEIDFLVTNSRTETFSMVTAEAVGCGKPAIVTRCGGPEDWFQPEYGLMIEPDRPVELQEALLKMAHSYRDYPADEIAQNLRERFGRNAVLDAYENLYDKLLK